MFWPPAIFYFAYLGALGLFWPYFALYLTSVGLSPGEATSVLALSPLMAIFAPPLAGLFADMRRARGWLLRVLAAGTAIASFGFLWARGGRLALYVTAGAVSFFRAPLLSMTDAAALDGAAQTRGGYGAVRVWGTIGFLVAVLAGGALFSRYGLHLLLGATSAAFVLTAIVAWLLPAPAPVRRPAAAVAWRQLVGNLDVWLLLVTVFLTQTAGAAYDCGFSLHLKLLGHGPRFIGLAWSVGLVAEIGVLAISSALVSRFGAERLLAFAVTVAMVRWTLLSQVTAGAAILFAQPLHGVTLGLYYVCAVTRMHEHAGKGAPTGGQGLVAGSYNAGSLLGMCAWGRLLEDGGGRAMFRSAAWVASAAAVTACAYAWSVARGRRAEEDRAA